MRLSGERVFFGFGLYFLLTVSSLRKRLRFQCRRLRLIRKDNSSSSRQEPKPKLTKPVIVPQKAPAALRRHSSRKNKPEKDQS